LWRAIDVVDRTGSTNADLLARAGAAQGQVLVAEEQTAGRGRMGRTWLAPPHAALTFSMLLRPAWVPAGKLGWLSLLTGVCVATAVRDVGGVQAGLKWPNDVLAGGRKLAGILAEVSGDTVVIGVGLNVSTTLDELPAPGPGALAATSVYVEGAGGYVEGAGRPASLDRARLLGAILAEMERRYLGWREDPGQLLARLAPEYRDLCVTLGREVRVEQPGGQVLSGKAVDVDSDGRLVLLVPSGPESESAPGPGPGSGGSVRVAVAAGDVVHVR